MNWRLPIAIRDVSAPPLKIQGIKTKLVKFIGQSIAWDSGESGRWVEPFFGSGCVALNLMPPRAILGDKNPHIVRLYKDIQSGVLTPDVVRGGLSEMGALLSVRGQDYYNEVRTRFNQTGASLDFLFLNRSCFNGVIRFNKKGGFNTPFGHKPQRFDAKFLTRVSNQVKWAGRQMANKDWQFHCADWSELFAVTTSADFVYLDPPYVGRHADYFSQWDGEEAGRLATAARLLPCGFALSMWMENQYRKNEHIESEWSDNDIRLASHFYHVGSSESLRNEMIEAVVIRRGFSTADAGVYQTKRSFGADPVALELGL